MALIGTVVGGVIGASSPLLSTWLSAYLKKNEDNEYDAKAKELLKKQLELHKWTDLETFQKMIGLDSNYTRQYLLLLKARGSRKRGSKKWGLIDKNPLCEKDTQ